MLGTLVKAMDGIFCPRGGSDAAKQKTVDLIGERQRSIEAGGSKHSPLIIFAEGTTTNNTHILKFKRGAFETLSTVQPIALLYHCPIVLPSNAILADYWSIIILMCTLKPSVVEVRVLPPFTPNDYLFKNHGDGNKPRWEVMGDAVREVMCEESGLKPCNMPFK